MMHNSPTRIVDPQSGASLQAGEEDIIRKVLETLPKRDRWCVEFGAWDGKRLSNTRNLIEQHGYSAVLIEGNPERFKDLQNNYSTNKNVIPINAFVGFHDADGLDRVLERACVPLEFDFLSIDIDGNDYHVWNATCRYCPKVICIEFNPTIHTDVDFVQPADPDVHQGAALTSLVRLGKKKGYELVCVLPFNAVFVREELFPLFGIRDNNPCTLRKNVDHVTHIFSGFDGRIFLRGNLILPWHSVRLKESRIQHLPSMLRTYPGNYSLIQRVLFKLFRFFFA